MRYDHSQRKDLHPEGAITPDVHEGDVRSLLRQARILSDDVYTKSYKIHQAITK
jgi:hypothetical protein